MSAEAPPEPEPNGRRYRSKKQRPCDVCRSRKIQCKLQGNEAVCEMCKKLGRRCTYVLGPLTRKYRGCATGDNTSRPDTVPLPAGSEQQQQQQQEDLARSDIPMQNTGDPQSMDVDPFWLPPDLRWSPRAFSNLLAVDWSAVEFPLGTSPIDSGRHFSAPRADDDGAPFPNATSPANNFRPNSNSGGTAHTVLTTESPSTAPDTDSQRSPHVADMGMQRARHGSDQHAIAGASHMDLGRNGTQNLSREFSLYSRKGYSSQLIGLSSESDPFLIRHYYHNEHDTYTMYRLHFRKVVDDVSLPQYQNGIMADQNHMPLGPTPIQFVMADEEIWADDVKATEAMLSGNHTEEGDMELLGKLVPPDLEARLLRLYLQFVHPRYPVLSLRDLERMQEHKCSLQDPIGLRSAAYALAAPFTFLDDELSVSKGYLQVPTEDLWAIAHRSFQRSSCISHLSSLQLCLLLLQMPPRSYVAAEPPSFWALSCSALALAESLGVNVDSADWRLPQQEIILRRRLWWFTFTTHTWLALVSGRPSHINDANWYVSPLTSADFEGDGHRDPGIRASILQQIPICLAQCELSVIAADVLKEFYTLRATRESLTLSALLSRAQPLRTRIESWRQTLPLLSKPASDLNEEEFEHGAALRISHLTLEILIFRALIRPLSFGAVAPAETSREPISTIFENSYTCAKVATDIVSSLRAKHFASFWPPYVRYQLCYVSTFIVMNLAQSATKEMAIRNMSLLSKWRDTLRIQGRAWPLARLATMRLDAIFWRGLSAAIHGAGPDSPAVLLVKELGIKGSGER